MGEERDFGSTCFYGGGDGCVAVDSVGCALIEKNAAVSSIKAIQRSRKPITIMVRIAPISVSNPVVPKRPTPVFLERVVNDLLKKTAATTTNTKSKTRLPKIGAI